MVKMHRYHFSQQPSKEPEIMRGAESLNAVISTTDGSKQ